MFGEQILYKPVAVGSSKAAKMETKFLDGIFLGLVERTGEYIVGTAEGRAERCRDFKRRPLGERWSRDLVFSMKGLPWAPAGPGGDAAAAVDDTLPRATAKLEAAVGPAVGAGALPPVPNIEYKSRALYVTARLLLKFGKTPGCTARAGKPGAHSDDCRGRILGEVMQDAAECHRFGFDPPSGTDLKRTAVAAELDEKAAGTTSMNTGDGQPVLPPVTASGDAEMTTAPTPASSSQPSAPLAAAASAAAPAASSSRGPAAMTDGSKRAMGDDSKEGAPTPKRLSVRDALSGEHWTLAMTVCEEEPQDYDACEFSARYVDEITGIPLPDAEVEKAMSDELAEYAKHEVAEEVSIESCWEATHARPVDCRWKVINKGDGERRDIRARLLAREMKKDKIGWETIFAGTPPLWAFRALCSSVRRGRPHATRSARKLRIIDIKRAFFHSMHSGMVHVMPPHLRGTGRCWRLQKAMYGTLSAAGDFQDTFVLCLKDEIGFVGGESSPCIFHDKKTGLKVVYHGDDVAVEGYAADIEDFTLKLGVHFELVVKATLGPEAGDDKRASLLNRLLTWEDTRLLWECDPRQIDLAIAELGLIGSKPRSTPGVKVSQEERELAVPLPPEAVRAYRGAAARIGYISHDRFDLLYAAKECLRGMQCPTDI
jgi:hypothetical protein